MKANFHAIHPVLMSPDVAASVEFYQNLGFRLSFVDQPNDPKYAGVVRDGTELHIQWAEAGQWAYPTDRPAYRFFVSDVDALYREFVDCGMIHSGTSQGSPWAVPSDTPWGTREFHIRDLGQNSLQFYQPQ